MKSKEFVKKQIKNFGSALNPEQFLELAEHEHSLIILDVPIKDYTLSEIARIVEDNNARIIRLEVLPLKDGISLLVLRSFERFSYNVIYYYMKESEMNDTYEDRLDELMHYLDM